MKMETRPELHGEDPIQIFSEWLHLAEQNEPNDPNAAALATATKDGIPSVRMVLVKHADQHGFNFYTNSESEKGQELAANPHAALCLHWKSLRRQVRIAGPVESLGADVSDSYFHSRSRRSQIGAAVSKQSRQLADRAMLEAEVARFEKSHEGQEVPRPDYWRGYNVIPERIEFWIDGPDRLHDRLLFTRTADAWQRALLYP